ncbi:MAG: efflux RND transporter permease subunit [Luteibacter sp.]|uniref:efflux RND transporter permease subunit n=1 Tax=Luteibacter sp. TaxID=1886636 RepID=UPI00280783AD|nr:efflux RND transporter permease subunit [Luteibacter sp.]MDQ7997221.1 efflux RND transporter permease subunit [Luteibacter sp.]MDQ8049437.1 efflux RND transporter permease subunit [Luteibacter sp.]
MNLSRLFIDRPVATSLLCLGLVVAGALAWRLLPIASLPEVNVPTIKVSAELPGASPATMVSAVATPLERALGRIAGLTEMTSVSTTGGTDVRLTFDLSRNVVGASRDVQAAINAARADLPSDMPAAPSYREVSSADAPVLVLGLTSRHATPSQMYGVASTTFSQTLAQVDGVGEVELVGSSVPAVRVALNPQAMNQRGVGFEQVRHAVSAAVSNAAGGAIETGDRYLQVATNGQFDKVSAFRSVVVAGRDGTAVPLGDIARIIETERDPHQAALANGEPAVLALVRHKPGSNTIDVIDGVMKRLPALQASLPGDMKVSVIVDRATSVRGSLRAAEHTLALAVVLVVLVMLVFLRDLRAALIASAVAPISLLGAMTAMYLLGYSLDILSLMALTIAVGFTVDDAVVVVENIARHIEDGVPPREAARVGAGEVGLTVVSMSAVLIAVFIPLLLMGGYVGLFVREFSVTLAVVIAISLVVSLTVVPMLCALWLQPADARRAPGRMLRWSERAFSRLQAAYDDSLVWALRRAPLTMLSLLAVLCLSVFLYITVPKGFFPRQDTGELTGDFDTDADASFPVARAKLASYLEVVRADPAIASVAGYVEHDSGSLFATLKPLSQRDATADEVAARINARLARLSGGTFTVTSVQNIRTGGRRSRASNEYTIQADSSALLATWVPRIAEAMARLPELSNVHGSGSGTGVATALHVDRDAAAQFGVSYARVDDVLRDAFAGRRVTTMFSPSSQTPVLMGIAPEHATSTDVFNHIEVPAANGASVPLPVLAHVRQYDMPLTIAHFAQSVATTISFDRAPGVSLSQATLAIRKAVDGMAVPTSVRGSLQGSAGAARQVADSEPALILGAFLTLFIVLGILYESCVHPLTILSTLPSAAVGAVFALMLFRTDLDVIALVGIFALVGIVMKNAIMMVDFALAAQRGSALTPAEAIQLACRLRFRPILMTSLAVMVAAVPLAVARGDGAEMHRPLGIAMGGGLVVSQLLTLYTTPVVYLYLDRFSKWAGRWMQKLGRRDDAGWSTGREDPRP